MTGHLLGAAGGVEAIASLLALHREVIARRPSIYETPIPSATSTTFRTSPTGPVESHVQLLRIRRTQRGAGLRPVAGVSASKAHELGGRDVSERMLEALTHASFAHEQQTATAHNERLEFLGDAVVNLVVAEELFRRHPDASEGRLSQMKAGIVSEKALADAFRRSGLKELLRLGRGEARSGGRESLRFKPTLSKR